MPEPKRPLKVFLCHAHADRDPVRGLYTRLTKDGVDAWLDKAKLLPGQDWELEIRKAVREADVVVVCLSKQFNQAGFRQKEVRLALDTAMEKPEGEIFIIPARLEECDTLESLRKWHWVDLFEDDGYEMLMRALQARADKIAATLQNKRKLSILNSQPAIEIKPTSPNEKHDERKREYAEAYVKMNLPKEVKELEKIHPTPDQRPSESPAMHPVEPRITVSPQPARTNTTVVRGALTGFVVMGICAVIGLVILLSVLNNLDQTTSPPSQLQSNPQSNPENTDTNSLPPGVYESNDSVTLGNDEYTVQFEGSGNRICEDAGLTFGVKFSFGTAYSDYEMNLNDLSFSLRDDQDNLYQLGKVVFDPYFNPTNPSSKTIGAGYGEIIFTCWKVPPPSERGAVYMFFTVKGLPGGKDITWRSLTP